MNPEFITRVVSLVQKNNDRVILADPQNGKAVVVLDLDSYERLCDAAASKAEKSVEPPALPAEVRLPNPQVVQKVAQPSGTTSRTRVHVAVHETSKEATVRQDLTQGTPADNMNRDIGAWKTAPARRRVEEPQSAPQLASQPETANVFEEEERFYLEPIE